MRSRLRLAAAVGSAWLAATAASAIGAPAALAATPITPAAPCGATADAPPAVTKIMVIVMENRGFDQVIGSPRAPTITAAAAACGLATDYHGIQYPSLPNYVNLVSGTAPPWIAGDGVSGRDCLPVAPCVSLDPSVFDQLTASGQTWTTYAESMPVNCDRANAAPYAARHNPATYFAGPSQRADCLANDVPMGTPAGGRLADDLAAGTLPTFGLVVPNLCHDGHDACGGRNQVAEQDAFVATWLPAIVDGADYQAGRLAVVLTWDTDARDEGNRVATVVLSPSTPAGTVSATPFDHRSLLRSIEDLAGLPPLAGAATATSMLPDFHLVAPPPAPTISSGPPTTTPDTTASVAFADADPAATFNCALDGAPAAPCISPWTAAGLAPGPHALSLQAVNRWGASPLVKWDWTVLAAAPATARR
jgi:phosphatidylinositol-3-phosphatase